MRNIDRKIALKILGVLLFFNVITWIGVYEFSLSPYLEVIFFDVGQGDAIFIQTPQRQQILIDGGPTSVILEKLATEMPFWDRTLDLIILTHPEHDHIGGLLEVLKSYKVENILWTGVIRETAEYDEWKKLIEEENAEIFIAKAGQKITTKNVFLEVLYPFQSLEGQKIENSNNTSIIIKLVFGKNSFLFTGDAYKSVENKLINKNLSLDSDVLKVGHHGSKTSTGKEFLEKVSPELAIISVGKDNPYGHPHAEVLEILKEYDIKVLRTDLAGDIKVLSNGKDLIFQIQQ